jgi:hypothetical protein
MELLWNALKPPELLDTRRPLEVSRQIFYYTNEKGLLKIELL